MRKVLATLGVIIGGDRIYIYIISTLTDSSRYTYFNNNVLYNIRK